MLSAEPLFGWVADLVLHLVTFMAILIYFWPLVLVVEILDLFRGLRLCFLSRLLIMCSECEILLGIAKEQGVLLDLLTSVDGYSILLSS